LHILPGGEVAAPSAEFVGNTGQLNHLIGGKQPAGNFAAHHLNAGLSLAVDAVFQAKWTKVSLGNFPSQEGQCLGPKDFNFFPDRFIVLILKLFPLREDFPDGRGHNHLYSGRD
jgi:hypothetical protein